MEQFEIIPENVRLSRTVQGRRLEDPMTDSIRKLKKGQRVVIATPSQIATEKDIARFRTKAKARCAYIRKVFIPNSDFQTYLAFHPVTNERILVVERTA